MKHVKAADAVVWIQPLNSATNQRSGAGAEIKEDIRERWPSNRLLCCLKKTDFCGFQRPGGWCVHRPPCLLPLWKLRRRPNDWTLSAPSPPFWSALLFFMSDVFCFSDVTNGGRCLEWVRLLWPAQGRLWLQWHPPPSESWRTEWRERDGSLHPLTSYLQTQLEPRAVLKLEAPVRPLARPHFHNLHVWSRSCKDRSSERWTVYGFSSDFMLEFDFAFTTPSTDECISNVTYHLIYLFFTDSKLHFLMIIFFFFYCSSLFSASCRLGSPKGGQRWLIGAQTEGVWRQMGIAPIMYAQFLICKSYNTLCAYVQKL